MTTASMTFRTINSTILTLLLTATCCAQNSPYTSAFSSSRYPGLMSASPPPLFRNGYSGHQGIQQSPTSHAAYPNAIIVDACQQCPTNAPVTCEPSPCTTCYSCPCDECGRSVSIDVSAVLLFRERPRSQQLLVSPINAAEATDAAAFDFGVSSGIEAGIISYDVLGDIDIELRGMWLDDWSDQVNQTFTGTTVQISASPPLGTSGPRSGFATYNSKFLSTELNARYGIFNSSCDTTFVLGVRAMRLDENLNATLTDPSGVLPDEIFQTSATNRLVGLQIGFDRVFSTNCNWCLKFTGRTGLYKNSGQQQSQLISLATPAVTFPANDSATDLAFQAELAVHGKFRLCSCANIIASYRAMYLNGLALAPEQLAATDFLTGSGHHNNSSLLLHGVTVGLELVY